MTDTTQAALRQQFEDAYVAAYPTSSMLDPAQFHREDDGQYERVQVQTAWTLYCAALAAQAVPAGWATHVQGCIEGWRVSADDQEANGHQETAETLRGCAADLARIHAPAPAQAVPAEDRKDAEELALRLKAYASSGGVMDDLCRSTMRQAARMLAASPAPAEAPCDMGDICIGCQPRNADGSCPDAPVEAKEEPTYCRYCQGSGESTHVVGRGPDAYDEPCNCDKCGGTGVFQAGRIVDVGQLEYKGRSVSHIHSMMEAYQYVRDTAWKALKKAGVKPDGNTSLAMGIERLATNSPAEVKEDQVTLKTHLRHLERVIRGQRDELRRLQERLSTPQPQAAQPVAWQVKTDAGTWGAPFTKAALAEEFRRDDREVRALGVVDIAAPALTEEQEYEAFKIWYSNRYRYDFDGPQSTWTHAAMCDAREVWRAALRSTQGGE
jgi:hypothetical protein